MQVTEQWHLQGRAGCAALAWVSTKTALISPPRCRPFPSEIPVAEGLVMGLRNKTSERVVLMGLTQLPFLLLRCFVTCQEASVSLYFFLQNS